MYIFTVRLGQYKGLAGRSISKLIIVQILGFGPVSCGLVFKVDYCMRL